MNVNRQQTYCFFFPDSDSNYTSSVHPTNQGQNNPHSVLCPKFIVLPYALVIANEETTILFSFENSSIP